jgi:hypothetical protein
LVLAIGLGVSGGCSEAVAFADEAPEPSRPSLCLDVFDAVFSVLPGSPTLGLLY